MSILANSNAIESGGYNLERSLRFRSSASAYLNRTPASAGNRQIWTISVWVKRGTLGVDQKICSAYSADSDSGIFDLRFTAGNVLYFGYWTSAQETAAVYRDPSAWYHIVVAVDSTQATASNRVKMYVNGSQVTLSGAAFAQNTQLAWNNNVTQNIGRQARTSDGYFDGYLAEFNSIDGQSLTPSSFGSTNSTTGVWQPAKYTGTYGTNGFYLPFTDTSSTTNLVKDSSGNANNWTPNNISLTSGTTYDSMTDVPTLTSASAANYCVLNPLPGGSLGIINANLDANRATASWASATATFGISSGKWYWEATLTSGTPTTGIGIAKDPVTYSSYFSSSSTGYAYHENGQKWNNNSGTSYGASFTTNDIIGVAFDSDNGTLSFYKNNVSQGTAFTGLAGATFYPAVTLNGTGNLACNFGQRPFSYTPPTGFVALNTYNLPTPTIIQGNRYMDATLYTGTGATQTITNAGSFKPDFVWIKARSYAENHLDYDSVRGTNQRLYQNLTSAESTATNQFNSFNSNGFTLGADPSAQANTNGATFVAWQWQAGQGTTSSNTSGSITSTVSVNTTAGFSVVTYTGTGSNATVGHGLGVAPAMVIVKRRNSTGNWNVRHVSITAANSLYLNLTNASQSDPTVWNSTVPTSTVFSIGTDTGVNASGGTYVAYCWAAISGYSAFGSYTGNGSADGPFVYTGFRPKFVMLKCSSASSTDWVILDTSRNTYNGMTSMLFPDLSDAENSGAGTIIDSLSNGFKLRFAGGVSINNNGSTYIYAAFAESPFKHSLGR